MGGNIQVDELFDHKYLLHSNWGEQHSILCYPYSLQCYQKGYVKFLRKFRSVPTRACRENRKKVKTNLNAISHSHLSDSNE